MGRLLHLLKADSPAHAAAVIGETARAPGAEVTVVLLDGSAPPDLPAGVALRRLGETIDHDALLDLIFQSDHVVTW